MTSRRMRHITLKYSHRNSNHKLQEELWNITDKTKLFIEEEGNAEISDTKFSNKCVCSSRRLRRTKKRSMGSRLIGELHWLACNSLNEWPDLIQKGNNENMLNFSKPQWDTTRMSMVKKKKKWKLISVRKDVEKLEPVYLLGGRVKWCRRCGQQWQLFQSETYNYHMILWLYS